MSAFLEIDGLSRNFGGVRAVSDMALTVEPGMIIGVIGPNGSGKTTFLSLLSGTLRPSAGRINLDGRRIEGIAAHRAVELGIARTFQTTRLFMRWPLQRNIDIAGQTSRRGQVRAGGASPLALTGLADRTGSVCASLSNAEQRLAMIAVALATRPRLLLLDEPAVGMSPSEAGALARVIRRIRDETGVSVMIVEHNMHLMMGLADRILAMNAGRRLAEGTPEDIRRHPEVIAAYLGG